MYNSLNHLQKVRIYIIGLNNENRNVGNETLYLSFYGITISTVVRFHFLVVPLLKEHFHRQKYRSQKTDRVFSAGMLDTISSYFVFFFHFHVF